MSVGTDKIAAQIGRVSEELNELEATLENWQTWAAANKAGSKEARSIMGRISSSTKNLEYLVKQYSYD